MVFVAYAITADSPSVEFLQSHYFIRVCYSGLIYGGSVMFTGIKLLTFIGMHPIPGLLLVYLMTVMLAVGVERCRYLHALYSHMFLSSLKLPNLLC